VRVHAASAATVLPVLGICTTHNDREGYPSARKSCKTARLVESLVFVGRTSVGSHTRLHRLCRVPQNRRVYAFGINRKHLIV
jgi:hypothetical protein